MEAIGAIDELVAALGAAKAEIEDAEIAARLTTVQGELYLILSDIASADAAQGAADSKRSAEPGSARSRRARGEPGSARAVAQESIDALEAVIDAADDELPPLRDFVLPGATRASAALHMARTICRRAERRAVEAAAGSAFSPLSLVYLNRLSDALFTLARLVDHRAGNRDTTFKSTL